MYMLWRQSSSSDVSCSWPAARIFFQSGNNEYETGMSQLRPVRTQGLETSHLIHRFGCVTTCLSFSRHGSVSISPWQTTEASLAVFFLVGARCLSAGRTWDSRVDQQGFEPPPAVCQRWQDQRHTNWAIGSPAACPGWRLHCLKGSRVEVRMSTTTV